MDEASERPAPSAQGTFAKTPLAHVLMYLREHALTGTLVVTCDETGPAAEGLAGESLLGFEAGALTQAKLPSPLDTLGFVLREKGAITEAQLDASLAQLSRGEKLQGRVLVAMGACDDAAIEDGVRDQVRRKALRLFALRDARYAYYNGVDLLAGWGAAERFADDALPVAWRGIRSHADPRVVDGVLARVAGQALRLRGGGGELQLFEFDRAEQSVLDVLRASPSTVEQLVKAAGSDARLGRLLAYVLMIAKQVDLVAPVAPSSASHGALRVQTSQPGMPAQRPLSDPPARSPSSQPKLPAQASQSKFPAQTTPANGSARSAASQPKMPAQTPPSKPPVVAPALSPELATKLREAQARYLAMQDENYFQMLEIETGASDDTIRQSFSQVAARWHPDRVPPSAESLREAYQTVFGLLNEAQQTLSDDTMRGRYLATVQEGGGTPNAQKKMVALIEAATDAQKAEICLRRREYDQAVLLARRALKVNPDDPNTLAVLAQALIEKPGSDPAVLEPEQLLVRAVDMAPRHDRAHTLLGTLYKRRGQANKAVAHFKLAMEANPRNLDATREVRLANMRGSGPPAGREKPGDGGGDKSGGGGLLSRWLKR